MDKSKDRQAKEDQEWDKQSDDYENEENVNIEESEVTAGGSNKLGDLMKGEKKAQKKRPAKHHKAAEGKEEGFSKPVFSNKGGVKNDGLKGKVEPRKGLERPVFTGASGGINAGLKVKGEVPVDEDNYSKPVFSGKLDTGTQEAHAVRD